MCWTVYSSLLLSRGTGTRAMRKPASEQPELSGPPDADRTQRELFAWSLLAGLLVLAALAGPFFAGRLYTRDDLGGFHLPVRAFYATQLARGEPFDWMPHLFSGFYLTGEGQAGTYHPLHLALYRCLPFRAALGWEWLAAYPAMLAGTWLFLRRRIGRPDAAMFGSLLFTFCGFNLLHFIHPNAVAVVAHVPWLLWLIDIVLLDSLGWKVALSQAGIALLTGSQLLLGHPQSVWFSLLAEAAWATFLLANREHFTRISHQRVPLLDVRQAVLERSGGTASRETVAHCPSPPPVGEKCGFALRQHDRDADRARRTEYGGSRLPRLVIAKVCGLLVGAVQVLPTADALAGSGRRSVEAAFSGSGSLHPVNLVQLVAPYMFSTRVAGQNTHELGLYLGAVPLMLVVWTLARRRKLAALRPLAWASCGFGLLALLLAFGKYGLLYRAQAWLPLVGGFRFPCRYLLLFHLATAVTAAIGFVLLVRDYQRSRGRRGRAALDRGIRQRKVLRGPFGGLWAVVASSLAVALAGLAWQHQPWTASVPAVLAGPVLLGTAALLVGLSALGVRFAMVGVILLAAADLGVYGLSYAVYPKTALPAPFVASAATPPADRPGRVIASPIGLGRRGLRTGNQIILAGWRRADGYAALEPRRRLEPGGLAALRAAGVRWVKRGEAADKIEGLVRRDRHWLEVPGPLPRVRLVSRSQPSQDPARDIEAISLESTALAETSLELPDGVPGAARIASERPGRLRIQTDCSTPQLLVVAESFHSGWQAAVAGKPREVLRVNGDFMGCRVGPGREEIILEFRPRSLMLGRVLSWLGMGLVFCCLAAEWLAAGTPRRMACRLVARFVSPCAVRDEPFSSRRYGG